MPSMESNRAKYSAAIEDGSAALVSKTAADGNPKPVPPATYPSAPNSFIRTPLPAINVQQPDMQRQWQTPTMPQSRIPPTSTTSNPVIGAQASSNIINVVQRGQALLLQTNNLNNASQAVLNLIAGTNISLSADSQGGVTITGSAASTNNFFTSRADYKRWTLWAQTGTGGIGGLVGVNDLLLNTQSGAITYSIIPPSSVDDFSVEQKVTGGTSGNFSAITGNLGIIPARDFSIFCPIRVSTATATMRVWVVATDAAGGVGNLANNDVPGATNIVGFRYSTTIGANWFAVVANAGTSQSTVDTGIAVNSAVANMLRVNFSSASNTYTFFIDGNQVATISTANNPNPTAPLGGFTSVACIGGVASTNAIRYSAFYTEARTVVTTN